MTRVIHKARQIQMKKVFSLHVYNLLVYESETSAVRIRVEHWYLVSPVFASGLIRVQFFPSTHVIYDTSRCVYKSVVIIARNVTNFLQTLRREWDPRQISREEEAHESRRK